MEEDIIVIDYPSREQRIQQLKEELQETDYIALKAYEGQDCSQYGDWKVKRQEIRDEINRIDSMLEEEWDKENTEVKTSDNINSL